MKRLVPYIYLLSFLIVSFSCTDKDIIDGGDTNPTNKKINEWIYDTMLDHYLWYDEMPGESTIKASYNAEPDVFFYNLLSKKDGKTNFYSSIEEDKNTKSYQGDKLSFGFEYQAWNFERYNKIGLQILYTIPNSPATDKEIKRGDWIVTLNGAAIGSDYYDILTSNTTIQVGIASDIMDENIRNYTLVATSVEDHPVYVSKIVSPENSSKKVGYLVYNHFTTGPGGATDKIFDTDLQKEISELATQGVSDFILDLRYNLGGYISSAQVMASALMPANKLDNIFCIMTYNKKQEKNNQSLNFIKKNHSGLNLSRIFVITSWRSASASELVIAGLDPYMDVYIIGDDKRKTEGKNVGSTEYTHESYNWVLHPIVCHVTNADEWDYSAGMEPTKGFEYSYENDPLSYELGDREESVLKSVLTYINGGSFKTSFSSAASVKSVDTPQAHLLRSSLENRKTKGIILDVE